MFKRFVALMAVVLFASAAWAEPGAFMLAPDIYGSKIVFTREGDIWLGNLTTGEAKRLTRHEGLETRARFSPDGTQIAFQGQYDGGTQVYVMPTEGGVPKRVTNHITIGWLEDWTPDGKKLLCRGPGAKGVLKPFLVPASGGPEEPIPLQQMGMGEIGPNGLLAFCRFNDIPGGAWFRYHGGSRNDIWIGDLKTNTFKKTFESKTQAQYPQWIDGRVFFVHENQATWTAVGARTIYVKPHTTAVERALIDREAVKDRREYVDRKSGGKVGYIFLSAMGNGDMSDFALQYGSQLDKDALIVDIRHNNGGYISAVLVSILKKQTYLRRSQRNSIEPGTRFNDAYEGALCMVIDEGSYSDGEGGPANWHYAKLGPLIGTHTFGALVGSEPLWPLIDGGGIQVPRYGNYRDDAGWVVEGNGMAPDIEVDNDPNLWAKGIDAQLDRAIQEMLDRSAQNPVKRPVQPPDPVKSGHGG